MNSTTIITFCVNSDHNLTRFELKVRIHTISEKSDLQTNSEKINVCIRPLCLHTNVFFKESSISIVSPSRLPRFLILSSTMILRRLSTSSLRKHFHSHHKYYIPYITCKICNAPPQRCPDHSHFFKLRAPRLL